MSLLFDNTNIAGGKCSNATLCACKCVSVSSNWSKIKRTVYNVIDHAGSRICNSLKKLNKLHLNRTSDYFFTLKTKVKWFFLCICITQTYNHTVNTQQRHSGIQSCALTPKGLIESAATLGELNSIERHEWFITFSGNNLVAQLTSLIKKGSTLQSFVAVFYLWKVK